MNLGPPAMRSLSKIMQGSFCGKVRSLCKFRSLKQAKVVPFLVYGNFRSPLSSALVKTDSKDFGLASGVAIQLVAHVLGFGRFAQIFGSVVASDSVAMVNFIDREKSMHIEPSEPVRSMNCTINSDNNVPMVVETSGNVSCFCHSPSVSKPGKNTSLRVVFKKLAQSCAGKIYTSHDDSKTVGLIRAFSVLVAQKRLAYFNCLNTVAL